MYTIHRRGLYTGWPQVRSHIRTVLPQCWYRCSTQEIITCQYPIARAIVTQVIALDTKGPYRTERRPRIDILFGPCKLNPYYNNYLLKVHLRVVRARIHNEGYILLKVHAYNPPMLHNSCLQVQRVQTVVITL